MSATILALAGYILWTMLLLLLLAGYRTAISKQQGTLKFAADGSDVPFVGLSVEIGDESSFESFAAFQQAVLEKSQLTLQANSLHFNGSQGKELSMEVPLLAQGNGSTVFGMPTVSRDGTVHDWATHHHVYETINAADKPLLRLHRKSKVLEINAGGHSFRGELKDNGDYVWTETLSE